MSCKCVQEINCRFASLNTTHAETVDGYGHVRTSEMTRLQIVNFEANEHNIRHEFAFVLSRRLFLAVLKFTYFLNSL